jgi:hypothetical protein
MARHVATQRLPFFDGSMRRVGDRASLDAKSGEALEKTLARDFHGVSPETRWLRS